MNINDMEGVPKKELHIFYLLDTSGSMTGAPIEHDGKLSTGSGLIISYVPQDTSFLRGSISELEQSQGLDAALFRAILRKLGFERVMFEKDISDFSEGQKKKVLIAKSLCENGEKVVFGGDFNVILTDKDVYNPQLFENNALFRIEVRQKLKAVEYLGYYDAFRVLHPHENGYTYWDYSGNAVALDNGMRIDYFWLSPKATDALRACYVDKSPRLEDKPSDHTPLILELT